MKTEEKRYFKLHSGSSGKGKPHKYIKLYDMLDQQTRPDESVIERAGFTYHDKKLLQQKILESLHVQYLKNPGSKLKWLLESMPWLYKHKHMEELRQCAKDAGKIAKKYELFEDALQVIHWKKELLVKNKESKNLSERYEQLVKEETEIRRKLDEEIDYHNLRVQTDLLRVKDLTFNKLGTQQKFEPIINAPILQNNVTPSSLKAQIDYFHLKSLIALYHKQASEAHQYAHQLIDVFENNQPFKRNNLSRYKSSLCLLAHVCHHSGHNKDIPLVIDKIEGANIGDKEEVKTVCLYGMLYAIKYLDKEKGKDYILKIDTLVEEDNESVRDGRKLTLFYNIVIFYSLFGEWQAVDEWLSKILNYKRTDDRRDLQYASRIWSLVNHYELESDDMDNHIQKVAKYLKTNQQYTETNQIIVQTFRNLYKSINREDRFLIWENLNNYLNKKIQEKTIATHQIGLDALQLWCQAKIQNTTIAAVIANA